MDVVAHHGHPVHHHQIESRRIALGIGEGGSLVDRFRIEKNEVGGKALPNETPVHDPERLRRERRHPSNSIFEAEYAQLADVPFQQPRVVAVVARVGNGLADLLWHAAASALLVYLILLLGETFWPGTASPWLDSRLFLWLSGALLLSAVIMYSRNKKIK